MPNTIQNMSMEQCDKFQKLTDQNKRAGHKTPALAALVATLEPAPAKPAAIARPAAPAAPAARPAPAAPARPAPARTPANPLADVAEHLLRQRASHRSSPPADSALAIVELKRRGIIYANGIFTQSNRSK